MAKEESAGPWSEVCKKVAFGDGLYRDCREKVPGFNGFQNSRFDASFAPEPEEDFTKKLLANAVKPPTPEDLEAAKLAQRGEEEEPEEGFFQAVFHNPWLLYGGLAVLLYLLFVKKHEIVTTETPKALPNPDPAQKSA